jgi:hypothetical protein
MTMEKHSKRERTSVLLEPIILIVIALALLSVSMMSMPPDVGLLLFVCGVGLTIVGLADVLATLHVWEKMRALHEQRMKAANQGIIAIWAICFVSICVYSILWFALGWATFSIIDIVVASYAFPAQAMLTITFMKLVIEWHPIFFIFGMLLWAYVNSQRREDVTYPS